MHLIMGIRDELKKYIPFNEQEERDRELMLVYMDIYGNDTLTRDEGMIHLTASNWIVNKDRTKVLMVHHNLYNSWAWTGGHADGEPDLRKVARREIEEETGLTNLKSLRKKIYAIQILPVSGHMKNGEYVAAHLHLDFCFLWEADDTEPLKIKEDENSDVQWIDINQAVAITKEEHMKPIYKKLNDKLKRVRK